MVTGPESEPLDGGTRAWRWMRSAASRTAVVVVTALVIASPVAAGCDDDDRPPTPISLKASPLSSGGIMLQWSSRVGHYDIYIRDKLGRPVPEAPDIVGGATNENYHEFYGLESGKEYFFSMRARSEGGREGCISKNISETVHATTDSAEMNQHCSYYARNAMEDVEEMRKLGCELPDSPIIGRWATHEGTQFTYCMGQQRAGLLGDANYSWLRNQDIQACKEVKRAAKCKAYAKSASAAARYNRVFHCGYTGPRWVSFDAHYNWCVSLKADSPLPRREARARAALLQICRKKRAGTQGGGGNNNCPGVPAEWADMLKAHNELRGQYCGSPLTWSCDLAADAKTYAEACKCGHGNPPGIGENLAARSAVPDKYPAGTDRQAFDDTWACEKDLYDFNKPVIVGGFKHNCLPPPAGEGVNGHFTQVVWKSTKEVGCGRARCPIVDKDCNVIKPESYETHWVCRYGPGGNDPDQLAQNVQKPPACTQSFRSNSEPITCSRGMVLIGGSCRCKPGEHWTGRFCRRFGRTSAGTSVAPAPAPAPAASTPTPTCPSDRPVGTYPNCCPSGTVFSDGTCRSGGGASTAQPGGGATSGGTGGCPRSRPVGTPPNCCPKGTVFSDGKCRRDRGTTGTQPGGGETPRCTGDRPVGTYPHCCPTGTVFSDGKCRSGGGGAGTAQPGDNGPSGGTGGCPRSRPVGSPPNCCPRGTVFSDGKCRKGGGGASTAQPGGGETPRCTGDRPVGTYPHCCPTGTVFSDGKCRKGGGGASTAQPGGGETPRCTGDRPVGTYPHCCPTGTSYQNGKCTHPTPPPTTPGSTTNPDTGTRKCTGGRIGRPPHCRCPPGTSYRAGRCRRKSSPTTPPGPTTPTGPVVH